MANRLFYGPPPMGGMGAGGGGLAPRTPRAGLFSGGIHNPLTYMGLGMLSQGQSLQPVNPYQGLSTGLGAYLQAQNMMADREFDRERLELERQRLEQAQATREAEAAAEQNTLDALTRSIKERNPELSDAQARDLALSGQGGSFVAPEAAPTGVLGQYQTAVDQGFPGTLLDYQTELKRAGRPTTNIMNIPQGYVPVDPNDPSKGVQVVKGGPADPERITPTEAAKLREQGATITNTAQALEVYRTALLGARDPQTGERKGGSGVAMVGEEAATLDSARTALAIQAKELFELGALSGPDMALINKYIGADPTGVVANVQDVLGLEPERRIASNLDQVETLLNNARRTLDERQSGTRQQPKTRGSLSQPQSVAPMPGTPATPGQVMDWAELP